MPSGPAAEPPIPFDQLRVEHFRENADVHAFDCGNKDLNDFLTTAEVANYEREKFGKTYLVYWQESGALVAYFTIANESLRVDYFKGVKSFSLLGEIRADQVPGVLIGRLAVDQQYKRRRIGSHILRYIAGLTLESSAAARVLFLEAYPESIPFYESFDFKILEHQKLRNRHNRLMWFDLRNHPDRGK